ncbi:MAG: hypothetical protein ACOX3K_05445 [Bacilli bacterium]
MSTCKVSEHVGLTPGIRSVMPFLLRPAHCGRNVLPTSKHKLVNNRPDQTLGCGSSN